MQRFFTGFRWTLPFFAAALLTVTDVVIDKYFALGVPPKGSTAKYNARAKTAAVFDLHEAYAEAAQKAKETYLPIYNRDNRVLGRARERLVAEALEAPYGYWYGEEGRREDKAGASEDAGALPGTEAPKRESSVSSKAVPVSEAPGGRESSPAAGTTQRPEIKALLLGYFRLLEPFYEAGVVADNEFPNEKKRVRLFTEGRYVTEGAENLYRFSELRGHLTELAAQFFFKTGPHLRNQVIDYVLQRLPANLSYAEENAQFITDISQVTGIKVELVREGDLLVRRGEIIDTRAYHAIRASADANDKVSTTERAMGRFLLLLAIFLTFSIATRKVSRQVLGSFRAYLFVYAAIVIATAGFDVALAFLPVNTAAMPDALVPMIVAVAFGSVPAMLVSFAAAGAVAVTHLFSIGLLLVCITGGMCAAITVRRRRRRTVLSAGILVGLAQALVFEASRAVAGQPQNVVALWSASQVFLGGVTAGLLAWLILPFVQRALGQAPLGKLSVLSDFDHPLVRRLREQAPDVFAHSVRVMNLAERAASAIRADQLLVRVAALYHDIGKLGLGVEEDGHKDARREHVKAGLEVARREGLPNEVMAVIREHHGTLPMGRGTGEQNSDPAGFDGPSPQRLETAIVMICNEIDRERQRDRERSPEALVRSVVVDLLPQFEECGLTHQQLGAVQNAIIAYLKSQ